MSKPEAILEPGLKFDASKLTVPFLPKYRLMEVTASDSYTVYDYQGHSRLKYMYKGIEYDAIGVRGVKTSAGATLAAGVVYLIS